MQNHIRAQGTIEEPFGKRAREKINRAQGTIEYLVILAIIIIVSLIIVGLVSSNAPTQQVSTSIRALSNLSQGGISVLDAVIDSSGNGIFGLQNNTGENLTITRINVGGIDNNYPDKQFVFGSSGVFSLSNLASGCSCTGAVGQQRTCTAIIYYTTVDGIEKKATYSVTVDCVDTATAADSNQLIPLKSVALCNSHSAGGYFYNGEGTLASPYGICDCSMLQNVSHNVSAYYMLLKNIDCSATSTWNSGAGFLPIGSYAAPFTGSLDGNNYSINGLFIDMEDTDYVGLFSSVSNSPGITNLLLTDTNITASNYVGGITGYLYNTLISNSSVAGTVTAIGSESGGLVGTAGAAPKGTDGNISSSYFSGTVNGFISAGGLVGHMYRGTINLSYSTGTINGTYSGAGGLVGNFLGGLLSATDKNSFILESYSTSAINGVDNSGGLVGYSYGGFLTDAYSSGAVTGNAAVGGLIGDSAVKITNSFATGAVSGAGLLGELAGMKESGGTFTTSYWLYTPSGPTSCYSDGNTGCTIKTDVSWFYSSANAPLSSWGTWSNISGSKYCTTNGNWCICDTSALPWLAWEDRSC